MHAFRKLLATSAAAIVAMASGVLVAHAHTPSVYDTPGGQISAGRLWRTTCEMYSSDTARRCWSKKLDIRTAAGAQVGMTVGQVKGIYGAGFTVVPKVNHGVTQYFGTVRQGKFELQFRVKGTGDSFYSPTRPLVDSDVIGEIAAQRYTNDVSGGGC